MIVHQLKGVNTSNGHSLDDKELKGGREEEEEEEEEDVLLEWVSEEPAN